MRRNSAQRDCAASSPRLADADAAHRAGQARATPTRRELREAQAKLALLETRLAESQTQQAALEALYRDLAPSRDELALTEVEQVLHLASQQLALAGNVQSALAALQLADAKLARARPPAASCRCAGRSPRDMDRLKSVPYVDVAGHRASSSTRRSPPSTRCRWRTTSACPHRAGAAGTASSARPHGWRFLHDVWSDVKAHGAHRSGGSSGRAAAAAAAAILPAREPAAAPAVGAHGAAFARRSELSSRRRGGRALGRSSTSTRARSRCRRCVATLTQLRHASMPADVPDLAQSLDRAAHAACRARRSSIRAGDALRRTARRRRRPRRAERVAVRALFLFLLVAAAARRRRAAVQATTRAMRCSSRRPIASSFRSMRCSCSLVAAFVVLYLLRARLGAHRAPAARSSRRTGAAATSSARAAKQDAARRRAARRSLRQGARSSPKKSLAIPHSSGLAALVGARAAIDTRDFDAAEASSWRGRMPQVRQPRRAAPHARGRDSRSSTDSRAKRWRRLAELKREAGLHTAALRLELRALTAAGRHARNPAAGRPARQAPASTTRQQGDLVRASAHAEALAGCATTRPGCARTGIALSRCRPQQRQGRARRRDAASSRWAATARPPRSSSRSLDRSWDSELVALYARLPRHPTRRGSSTPPSAGCCSTASDATLLYALGRLCERRIALGQGADLSARRAWRSTTSWRTHVALGELLARLGRDDAGQCPSRGGAQARAGELHERPPHALARSRSASRRVGEAVGEELRRRQPFCVREVAARSVDHRGAPHAYTW